MNTLLDDAYLDDYRNIQLMSLYSAVQLDSAVWKHINKPVGTRLIRISPDEFEADNNDRDIYMEHQ